MADRTVRVRLSASVDEYTSSVRRAANATEDLQDKAERFERRYRAKLDVDIDEGDLRNTEGRLRRLNGGTSNHRVRIDTRGASRNVQMLTATIAALGPAAVAAGAVAGAGLLSVANAASVAGAAAMTAGLAFYGTGDALKALNRYSDEYADNAIDAAKKRSTAAQSGVNSARAVEAAERGVASAQRAVAAAQAGVVQAQKQETRAHREVTEALEDLNRARQQAIRDMEDMRERSTDLALDAEDADIALIEARQRLSEVTADSTSTELELRKARLEVARAEDRVSDVQTDTLRSRADLNAAEAAGIDGMDGVVNARRRVISAEEGVVDAQIATAQAVEAVAVAMEGVTDAQRAVSDAQQSAAASGADLTDVFSKQSAEAKKLQQTMAKLAPEGREFVLFLYSMKPVLADLRASAQRSFLPGFQAGILEATKALPEFTNLVEKTGSAMGEFAFKSGDALSSPYWRSYFNFLADEANPTFDEFGEMLWNVAEGIAGMQMAWAPHARAFNADLVELTQRFADWGVALQNRQGMEGFATYVQEIMPDVIATLGSLLGMFTALAQAAAPISPAVLAGIRALADAIAYIASLPLIGPTLIATAVALGVLNRAMRLAAAIRYSMIIQGLMGVGTAASASGAAAGAAAVGWNRWLRAAGLVGAAALVMHMAFRDGKQDNKEYADSIIAASGGLDNMSGSLLSLNDAFNKAKEGSSGFLGSVREGLGGTVTASILGVSGPLKTERMEDEETIAKKRGQFIEAIEAEIARNRQLIEQYPQVARQLQIYREAQEDYGVTSREAALALGPLQQALRDAADAQDVLAGNTVKAMEAARAQANMFLSEIDASVAFKSAILDINEAVGAEGFTRTLDENTRAGQNNISMLTAAARAADEDLKQKVASGKYTRDELLLIIQQHNDALIANAGKLGATTFEAEQFVNQLRLIPGNYIPNFYTPTLPGVQANVQKYLDTLRQTTSPDGTSPWAAFFHTNGLVGPDGAIAQTQTLADKLFGVTQHPWNVRVVMSREFADAIWAPFGTTSGQVRAGGATGGKIVGPGTGTSDSIVLRGSDGEWIINERESSRQGDDKMRALNEGRAEIIPRFADGGRIGAISRRGNVAGAGMAVLGGINAALPLTPANAKALAEAVEELRTRAIAPFAAELSGVTIPAVEDWRARLASLSQDVMAVAMPTLQSWRERVASLSADLTGVTFPTFDAWREHLAAKVPEAFAALQRAAQERWAQVNFSTNFMTDNTRQRVGEITGPIFGSLQQSMQTVQQGAGMMASIWGTQLDTLRAKTADPIRWSMLFPLGKDGLAASWNKLATQFQIGEQLVMPLPAFAKGGPVRGPGHGTSDSILARVSNNEHVWTEKEVEGAGGHGVVKKLREAARHRQLHHEGIVEGADHNTGGYSTVGFGGVKPHVAQAGHFLKQKFNIATVGGVGRRSGPSDHPRGLALDFMTYSDMAKGDALSNYVQQNAAHFAVKYIIWRQRINQGGGWKMMEDRGSPTANHMDHPHVSFLDGPGGGRGFLGGGDAGAGFFDPTPIIEEAFARTYGMVNDITKFHGTSPHVLGIQRFARLMVDKVKAKAFEKILATAGGPGIGPLGAGAPFYVAEISRAARDRGLGREGATIGTATALVESNLRMLANRAVPESFSYPHDGVGGDHDSIGLFQQRQAGWGTVAQRMNAYASAGMFYNRFPPNWRHMPPGEVAANVQRPAAQYRGRYATRMPQASQLVAQYGGAFDGGGVASGRGFMLKDVITPERVLDARTTRGFDRFVSIVTDPRFLPRFTAITRDAIAQQVASGGGSPALIGSVNVNMNGEVTARKLVGAVVHRVRIAERRGHW